jgi:hypothetical protein
MSGKIDLLNREIVENIISSIEKRQEEKRKEYSFNSWQIYSGNQIEFVEKELKRVRPKSYDVYTVSNVSLAKMVVDKLARSYRRMPKRSVEEGIKNERLHEIYSQADAKTQLPYIDKIMNLHKHALMWVNWNDQYEHYQFMALQPHEYSLVRDKDTGRLQCVVLNYPDSSITKLAGNGDGVDDLISESQSDSSAVTKVYAIWSEDQFIVVKVSYEKIKGKSQRDDDVKLSITYIRNPDNPSFQNKLGFLPFVYVSKEPSIDYPTPNPLPEQSVTYNVINSEGLTSANIQGTGQLVLKYPVRYEQKINNMTTGLTSAIKLPQSSDPDDARTEADYISPSPDLKGQMDYYLTYLRQVLAENGITSSQGIDGSFQSFSSGLERMIANADVQAIIEDNQIILADMEMEMFKLIVKWEQFLGKNTFSDDDNLKIIFPKPKMQLSDGEALANLKTMLEMGLIEEWEKYQHIDPNLSDEEAMEKLERVRKQKEQSAMRVLNGGSSNKEDRA